MSVKEWIAGKTGMSAMLCAIAVAVPAAVALADPSLADIASVATVQVAASVVISSVFAVDAMHRSYQKSNAFLKYAIWASEY